MALTVQLLRLLFHRQTVAVPSKTAADMVSCLAGIPGHDVLQGGYKAHTPRITQAVHIHV
jgi:hypothetical protein